jgi:hypothetical protein
MRDSESPSITVNARSNQCLRRLVQEEVFRCFGEARPIALLLGGPRRRPRHLADRQLNRAPA